MIRVDHPPPRYVCEERRCVDRCPLTTCRWHVPATDKPLKRLPVCGRVLCDVSEIYVVSCEDGEHLVGGSCDADHDLAGAVRSIPLSDADGYSVPGARTVRAISTTWAPRLSESGQSTPSRWPARATRGPGRRWRGRWGRWSSSSTAWSLGGAGWPGLFFRPPLASRYTSVYQ